MSDNELNLEKLQRLYVPPRYNDLTEDYLAECEEFDSNMREQFPALLARLKAYETEILRLQDRLTERAARLAALEAQHAADERALRMAREAVDKLATLSQRVEDFATCNPGTCKDCDFNRKVSAEIARIARKLDAALPEPPTDAGK